MAKQNKIIPILLGIFLIVALAACGSRPSNGATDGNDGDTGAGTGRSNVAAMPAASFKSVADQSSITTTTQIVAPEVETEEDAPNLALGERVYGNKCAECHGPNAEGIPDKGSALAALSQPLAEFEDLLRTGGDIGPEHLFGTLDVSANGLAALHAYLAAQ